MNEARKTVLEVVDRLRPQLVDAVCQANSGYTIYVTTMPI